MAYMSQEKKQKLAPEIKTILNKYGVKGSLAVRNHSTLVLNIKSGSIDFIDNHNTVMAYREINTGTFINKSLTHIDVNPYHFKNQFTGKALEFLTELFIAMNEGNHNNSDMMTDYFDVGFYVDVNVGAWNKPYQLVK